MTLSDLRALVYENCGYQASPATAVVTRVTNHLNLAYRTLLREPGLARLRETTDPLPLASVASQKFYGLPAQISQVRAITETDNDRMLAPMTLLELRLTDPGLSATGTPWAYIPLGYKAIAVPPGGTGVWAVSSSAADTTQAIQINGVLTSGLATGDQSATLTGATRVQIGTLTTIADLQTVSLDAVAAGTVTLYNASTSGTALAAIPIGAQAPQYFQVQLYPTPDAVITYYVDGVYRIPGMDDAQDVPMLPDEFHDVLAAFARAKEWEYQDDPRFETAMAEYRQGVSRLKHVLGSAPGEIPVLGRMLRRRYSRYGAWAPAERW